MNFLKSYVKVMKHVCNHFYNSKFATHFYTPVELSSLSLRWTSRDENQDIDYAKYGIVEENIFQGLELWEKPMVDITSEDQKFE